MPEVNGIHLTVLTEINRSSYYSRAEQIKKSLSHRLRLHHPHHTAIDNRHRVVDSERYRFRAKRPKADSALLFRHEQLLPLMLQSLELPDARMRTNLIQSLTGIMESADSSSDAAIHGHAKTLATTLLRLATSTQDPSVDQRCRNAALRCLAIFPDVVRYDVLQSVKSMVIRELAKALDDPKRSVRRQAVDTRARWYRYGTAT